MEGQQLLNKKCTINTSSIIIQCSKYERQFLNYFLVLETICCCQDFGVKIKNPNCTARNILLT